MAETRRVSTISLCHHDVLWNKVICQSWKELSPVTIMIIIDIGIQADLWPVTMLHVGISSCNLQLSPATCCTWSQIWRYARPQPRKHICCQKKLLHRWAREGGRTLQRIAESSSWKKLRSKFKISLISSKISVCVSMLNFPLIWSRKRKGELKLLSGSSILTSVALRYPRH